MRRESLIELEYIGDGTGIGCATSNRIPVYDSAYHETGLYKSLYVGGKETECMSFVGIILFKNGILGFGDTKSTLKDAFGNMTKEQGRIVQKVFKFPEHIVVTFGNNNVFDKEGNKIRIEDFINERLSEGCDIYGTLDMLKYLLERQEKNRQIYGTYEFIIGGMMGGQMYTQYVTVDAEAIIMHSRIYSYTKRHLECGTPVYMQWFDELYGERLYDLSLEEMQNVISNELSAKIRETDEKFAYNPVGLPLRFETIKF